MKQEQIRSSAFLVFIVVLIVLTSCSGQVGSDVTKAIENVIDCKVPKAFPGLSKSTADLKKFPGGYFPAGTFTEEEYSGDEFMNEWYGKNLRAMNEVSLLDDADKIEESYRFLWLRTFHHPIAVTISKTGNTIKLTMRELDGAGGYTPGKIIRSEEREVPGEDWCALISMLDKAEYWSAPSRNSNLVGYDGAQWILEGIYESRYHIVDRWSPREGDRFRDACLFLIKLSGRDPATIEYLY